MSLAETAFVLGAFSTTLSSSIVSSNVIDTFLSIGDISCPATEIDSILFLYPPSSPSITSILASTASMSDFAVLISPSAVLTLSVRDVKLD